MEMQPQDPNMQQQVPQDPNMQQQAPQVPQDPNMQQQAPQSPQGASQLPPPDPKIISPIVAEHMDELDKMRESMDGKLGDAYDRVLAAGMKMLYSPEMADKVTQLIEDDSMPIANRLGEGVANLMVMMDNTGNGTIPKEVIIPVGIALTLEAADYLFEIGVKLTEQDLGSAIEIMMNGVYAGYGIDPKSMGKFIDDLGEKMGFKEEAEAAPEPGESQEPSSENAAFEQGFTDDQSRNA